MNFNANFVNKCCGMIWCKSINYHERNNMTFSRPVFQNQYFILHSTHGNYVYLLVFHGTFCCFWLIIILNELFFLKPFSKHDYIRGWQHIRVHALFTCVITWGCSCFLFMLKSCIRQLEIWSDTIWLINYLLIKKQEMYGQFLYKHSTGYTPLQMQQFAKQRILFKPQLEKFSFGQ